MFGFSNRQLFVSTAASSCCLVLTLVAGLATGCGDDGAGGSGGAGGGGTGGSGGGSETCLDPATYADLFTVKDSGFCVVALYDADKVSGSPTWGRHGGPMFVEPAAQAGSISIVRLGPVPAGTSGKLEATSLLVDVALPDMVFLGAQAIDLPFFGWTAVSYTDANVSGEVILVDGPTVATRYGVNGFFSGVGVGDESAGGRLVYSGLSVVGDVATKKNAVYAADACGSAGSMPRLLPEGDMTCKAPVEVSAFGDYSGPVAADRAGNVFVVHSTLTEQTARAFAAEKIKPGAAATPGDELFKLSGFALNLAAVSPDATGIGVVAFQPSDGTTYEALDVIAQRYRVDAGAVVPEGVPGTLLALTTPNTGLPFFTDDQDRLWVTAKRAQGVAVAVLARKP